MAIVVKYYMIFDILIKYLLGWKLGIYIEDGELNNCLVEEEEVLIDFFIILHISIYTYLNSFLSSIYFNSD